MQRRETCSEVDHAAQLPAVALYAVSRYTIMAVAHSMMVSVFHMLMRQEPYREL